MYTSKIKYAAAVLFSLLLFILRSKIYVGIPVTSKGVYRKRQINRKDSNVRFNAPGSGGTIEKNATENDKCTFHFSNRSSDCNFKQDRERAVFTIRRHKV